MFKRPLHAVLLPAAVLAALFLAVFATPAQARFDDVKYYVVQESYKGEQEYLYEIAERFLGDDDRNTEIFALNKGRAQPDGMTLEDPEEIEAGWILQLPPDAQGEGVRSGPLPSPSASPASTPSAPSSPSSPPSPSSSAEVAAAPGQVESAPSTSDSPWLLVGLLSGALVLIAAGPRPWPGSRWATPVPCWRTWLTSIWSRSRRRVVTGCTICCGRPPAPTTPRPTPYRRSPGWATTT